MMTPWEIVLIALGGNATLLVVLGFLARSLTGQVLAKDLEKFKADLVASSSATTERLKHELQLAAQERNVLFTKLHEKRAAVIADLYGLLVEAHWASQDFASPMEWAGEPTKQEKYVAAMNKSVEFYRYFDKNRIYLPRELCEKLESFLREMRSKVIGFGVYVRLDESNLPDESIRKKMDAWTAASDYFDKEAPKTRAALEAELRKIIGAGEGHAS
jgi:hypothetical protein